MDYDQNPVIVHTQYTYEEMKGFQRHHVRNSRRFSIVVTVFLCLVLIPLWASMLTSGGAEGELADELFLMFLPSAILLLIVAVLPLLIYSGVFYTRKQHERATKLLRQGQRYEFRFYDFSVITEQESYAGQSMVHYQNLYRVSETRDMFYLYIDKRQAYLVSKQGFQSGAPDDLRYILQNNIPPRKYRGKRD